MLQLIEVSKLVLVFRLLKVLHCDTFVIFFIDVDPNNQLCQLGLVSTKWWLWPNNDVGWPLVLMFTSPASPLPVNGEYQIVRLKLYTFFMNRYNTVVVPVGAEVVESCQRPHKSVELQEGHRGLTVNTGSRQKPAR